MFSPSEIDIAIEDVDDHTIILRVTLPLGVVEIMGTVVIKGEEFQILGAHIGGLKPGALRREGLNDIFSKALKELGNLGVTRIYVEGASRTTGRNPGRAPKPIRYPR